MSASNVRFRHINASGEYSDAPVDAAPVPILPDVERLSPRVIRVLGGNPSKFTLQGTNTYLIGEGPQRILIDSGQGKPAWINNLRKTLTEENATVDRVIITHRHFDHTGGIPDLLSHFPDALIFKHEAEPGQEEISDGQIFETEGAKLRALHCPGHTTDHIALILEEEDAIFTGDNVLGHGTAVFENLGIYISSLELMASQVSSSSSSSSSSPSVSDRSRGYPAHGAIIPDIVSKISEYIAHRQGRENQILEILGRPKKAEAHETLRWSTLDVVKMIYTELASDMWFAAKQGVRLVLEKLEAEGRVKYTAEDDSWVLVDRAVL